MAVTGKDIVAEVLASEGVERVFGNPGSTELAFVDACAARSIGYVLALQEASVVALADGYVQASGRTAVCSLHTSSGLGNALGNLVNASWNRTPLVVTAGQQDRRHLRQDPLLSGDLVGMAAPLCRSAEEVTRADDLGLVLRRAFRRARAEPTGPACRSRWTCSRSAPTPPCRRSPS
jgi:benzoylformate decarboxylase